MVQVVRAGKADETTLDNLLQLYLYEISAFDGSQIPATAGSKSSTMGEENGSYSASNIPTPAAQARSNRRARPLASR